MTQSPSKHDSGHHKAAEEEDDPGNFGKRVWRRRKSINHLFLLSSTRNKLMHNTVSNRTQRREALGLQVPENVDGELQVQLEEDGGGSSRQSSMESSGMWPMIY